MITIVLTLSITISCLGVFLYAQEFGWTLPKTAGEIMNARNQSRTHPACYPRRRFVTLEAAGAAAGQIYQAHGIQRLLEPCQHCFGWHLAAPQQNDLPEGTHGK